MARFIDTRNANDFRLDQLEIEMRSVDGFTRLMNGIDDDLGHNVIEVIFDYDEAVSQAQFDSATAVIDAHVPGALDIKLLRYSLTSAYNSLEVPLEVDYVNGISASLYRSVDEYDPLLTDLPKTVTFYAEAEQDQETFVTTYGDAVVVERYEYVVDETDAVRSTTKTVSWVMENGDEHSETKTITTYD
jgi:hypothetical protein